MDQSKSVRRSISSFLRQGMLFTIGSALILEEKVEGFIEHAIERGQEAQDEGQKMVQEMRLGKKKPQAKDTLDIRINNTLERLDVPSQKDIDELNQQITALSRQIDELKSAD
jgi:polyhydroxyalkanoate synthesis regulator phasin